ncbi:adenylyl-sulfate kinase [Pararobbsia silviterrae]|uniref:Adenylyl-sulfate kinase n=1 Tax=Pararobbsia silviterrae TaxID=1792498 RepID=A0A494YG52_9BURK|nr:adenylyl-sulfate kinase [Pararobbsia silviterrae]
MQEGWNEQRRASEARAPRERASNVVWQQVEVSAASRAALTGNTPCVLWFTGLSGAGKSTIANVVEKQLHAAGRLTYLLDGDNLRYGLNSDLGFSDADRVENIRRVSEVAKLMVDAGLITIVCLISPFSADRRRARELIGAGRFIEVFVDTPLDVAEARDPKGLYKKARRGEIRNFTAIDSPYERPEHAEIVLDTTSCSPESAAATIIAMLNRAALSDALPRAEKEAEAHAIG